METLAYDGLILVGILIVSVAISAYWTYRENKEQKELDNLFKEMEDFLKIVITMGDKKK